ncbi:MAG: ankyrin repeat domain-containing protein [Planctomyces sp.]|nr:ankyrin repeat domain-containing protein [Planctomyces sp.]
MEPPSLRQAGLTALHEAATSGHLHVVLVLLGCGARVDVTTEFGSTPLMCAAAFGQVDVARVLLACGADVNFHDKRGGTALDIANEKCEDEMAEFLESFAKHCA